MLDVQICRKIARIHIRNKKIENGMLEFEEFREYLPKGCSILVVGTMSTQIEIFLYHPIGMVIKIYYSRIMSEVFYKNYEDVCDILTLIDIRFNVNFFGNYKQLNNGLYIGLLCDAENSKLLFEVRENHKLVIIGDTLGEIIFTLLKYKK